MLLKVCSALLPCCPSFHRDQINRFPMTNLLFIPLNLASLTTDSLVLAFDQLVNVVAFLFLFSSNLYGYVLRCSSLPSPHFLTSFSRSFLTEVSLLMELDVKPPSPLPATSSGPGLSCKFFNSVLAARKDEKLIFLYVARSDLLLLGYVIYQFFDKSHDSVHGVGYRFALVGILNAIFVHVFITRHFIVAFVFALLVASTVSTVSHCTHPRVY